VSDFFFSGSGSSSSCHSGEITVESLREIMRRFDGIYCHPDNLAAMQRSVIGPPIKPPEDDFSSFSFRFRCHTSPLLPTHTKTGRVLFPQDPFVEYEASDRGWALALGIAKEELSRSFFAIKSPLLCW
jgi:hypothetical protein